MYWSLPISPPPGHNHFAPPHSTHPQHSPFPCIGLTWLSKLGIWSPKGFWNIQENSGIHMSLPAACADTKHFNSLYCTGTGKLSGLCYIQCGIEGDQSLPWGKGILHKSGRPMQGQPGPDWRFGSGISAKTYLHPFPRLACPRAHPPHALKPLPPAILNLPGLVLPTYSIWC